MDFEGLQPPSRHGVYIENGADFDANGIPRARARNTDYWGWVGKLLSIQPPASSLVDRDAGARPFFGALGGPVYTGLMSDDMRWEAMRRRERRIAEANNAVPYRPTIAEVVSEVVEAVREAVKPRKPTELQRAKAWLQETLASGPMLATAVEKLAIKAGISKRTLRRAAKSVKVQSRRKGRGPWVWSPLQAESHDGQER
jgi:hypothetical protein